MAVCYRLTRRQVTPDLAVFVDIALPRSATSKAAISLCRSRLISHAELSGRRAPSQANLPGKRKVRPWAQLQKRKSTERHPASPDGSLPSAPADLRPPAT